MVFDKYVAAASRSPAATALSTVRRQSSHGIVSWFGMASTGDTLVIFSSSKGATPGCMNRVFTAERGGTASVLVKACEVISTAASRSSNLRR
jgi:hypothetical protein